MWYLRIWTEICVLSRLEVAIEAVLETIYGSVFQTGFFVKREVLPKLSKNLLNEE